MDIATLPKILEIKHRLDGSEKRFRCHRLERDESISLTVLFIATELYRVRDIVLPVGTVTFGHFWSARPYNVYHWISPEGVTLGLYFNLASDTTFDDATVSWRDLVLDVLVRPGALPEVLDEDELPPALEPPLHKLIADARARTLADVPSLILTLEAAADRVWPRLFGRERATS